MPDDLIIPLPAQLLGEVQETERQRETDRQTDREKEFLNFAWHLKIEALVNQILRWHKVTI